MNLTSSRNVIAFVVIWIMVVLLSSTFFTLNAFAIIQTILMKPHFKQTNPSPLNHSHVEFYENPQLIFTNQITTNSNNHKAATTLAKLEEVTAKSSHLKKMLYKRHYEERSTDKLTPNTIPGNRHTHTSSSSFSSSTSLEQNEPWDLAKQINQSPLQSTSDSPTSAQSQASLPHQHQHRQHLSSSPADKQSGLSPGVSDDNLKLNLPHHDFATNFSQIISSPKATRATYATSTSTTATSSSNSSKSLASSDSFTAPSLPTETINSIRRNVTRILDMYFRNITDEFGYGAATTTSSTTTTSTTTALPFINDPIPSSLSPSSNSMSAMTSVPFSTEISFIENANYLGTATTTATATATATPPASLPDLASSLLRNATRHLASQGLNGSLSEALANTKPISISESGSGSTSATFLGLPAVAASMGFNNATKAVLQTAPSITYPTYAIPVQSQKKCFDLYADYVQPQQGLFCNWTWDTFLCWPPTPAGVLARMNCPAGFHGIDVKKFANRKCELDGRWGGKPNETSNPIGWTDFRSCYKPEVDKMMSHFDNWELTLEIAHRTRSLEMVGLVLSLFALIISLVIFFTFRSLRNNRTRIHKNLFIAMVLQVLVRLTLYVDQAIRRANQENIANDEAPGIEKIPYLCAALYVLLEYLRTTMFMWMFIEGLYLHNMVTVAVFQGRFPHKFFSLVGWGLPATMTAVWAICTAYYTDTDDCWVNYNLTPYYWILEGPRSIVILLNFVFLINIISVLVVKLRQSQASDIEQTRKAVRAAIVLLPLLGITNLLHLIPPMNTSWMFATWSYVTYFLTSFQGFFIALIYCFLNGEVRAALSKSIAVFLSVRGHPEWVPKRASMYSAAYNTAHDTEAQAQGPAMGTTLNQNQNNDNRRNDSPQNRRNGRKPSTTTVLMPSSKSLKVKRLSLSASPNNDRKRHQSLDHHHHQQQQSVPSNHFPHGHNNNGNHSDASRQTPLLQIRRTSSLQSSRRSNNSSEELGRRSNSNWMVTLCFRGQKVLRVPSAPSAPPESVVFELSEQ